MPPDRPAPSGGASARTPPDRDAGGDAQAVAKPSEADAVAAFAAARRWLDRDELPALDAPEALVQLDPSVIGAAAVLRLDGRVVGSGSAKADDAPGLMIRRALGQAVSSALGDETIRAVRKDLGDRVTARLSLEIELAGPQRPLLGRTIAEASARVVPGRDGLALLRGSQRYLAFPSLLSATDTAGQPEFTMTSLLRQAGLPIKEPSAFDAAERVSFARFASTRLRQPDAGGAPTVIERGGETVPLSAAGSGLARTLSAQLCARLIGQVVPRTAPQHSKPQDSKPQDSKPDDSNAQTDSSAAALLGPYNPTADKHQPPFASDRDAALASFALARASSSPAIAVPLQARARAQAERLLDGLRETEKSAFDPETNAYALLAATVLLEQCRTLSEPEEARSKLPSIGRVVFFRDRLAAWPVKADSEPTKAFPVQAMVYCAAARTLARNSLDEAPPATPTAERSPPTPEEGAILALLRRAEFDPSATSGDLPTGGLPGSRDGANPAEGIRASLLQAMLPLAILERHGRLSPEVLSELSRFLDQASGAIARAQLVPDPVLDIPDDLEGGLPLGDGRTNRADTRCLMLAAALAERPSPRASVEVGGAGVEALGSVERRFLRFLSQHVADSPWCEGFRNPSALRGLVRGSLASDDCPPAATAAGLLLAAGLADRQRGE